MISEIYLVNKFNFPCNLISASACNIKTRTSRDRETAQKYLRQLPLPESLLEVKTTCNLNLARIKAFSFNILKHTTCTELELGKNQSSPLFFFELQHVRKLTWQITLRTFQISDILNSWLRKWLMTCLIDIR